MKKVLCSLLLLGLVGLAGADTINLSVDVSGSVFKHRFTTAGDGQTTAETISGDANDRMYRAIMEWDTSAMPEISQISKVEINFRHQAIGSYIAVNMASIPANGSVLYENDYASTAYHDYGEIIAADTTDGYITYDVTTQVLDDLDNSRAYSGFRFYWPLADGFGSTVQSLSEAQLIVTTVPEPMTCGLLVMGGVAALIRKRK